MAYPPIYNITYSYTGFQQSQGNNSFPGTQLDADLAGLSSTIDGFAAFVERSIRSDGQLQNGLVTFDSLAPSLQLAGLQSATAWLTGTSYLLGNPVTINSNLYRCLIPHTSGVFATDLANGKWLLVSAVQAGPQGIPGTNGANGAPGATINGAPSALTTGAGLNVVGTQLYSFPCPATL